MENDILQLVLVAAALLSGLISGQMLAIAIANWAARVLPEMSWTLRFQVENKYSPRRYPLFDRRNGSHHRCTVSCEGPRILFYARLRFFTAIVLVTTMVCNVPINNQVSAWMAGRAPPIWIAIRDRWLIFHAIRTITGVIAFGCVVIALIAG